MLMATSLTYDNIEMLEMRRLPHYYPKNALLLLITLIALNEMKFSQKQKLINKLIT